MTDNTESKTVDAGNDDLIRVEVAYALPGRQRIVELEVKAGCTALEAVNQSGISRTFPELADKDLDLGIFSRPLNGTDLPLPGDYVLEAGDRVEIYRPLTMDPKEARLVRAKRKLDRN